jgi:FkbM family methyltransferase
MLISVDELHNLWNIRPKGVVHVGAHLAEESDSYVKHNWGPVIWVEAQPSLVEELRKRLDPTTNSIIEAAVWNESGIELELHIASNSQSTSLLDFGSHLSSYPDITFTNSLKVTTQRLEELLRDFECPNFINLDLQGVELQALEGLGEMIEKFNFIFVEVNRKEVYIGCTLVSELDLFLSNLGFRRVASRWFLREGWGDAFYIRESYIRKRKFISIFKFHLNNFAFYTHQFVSQVKNFFLGRNIATN